jgi:hypothetical protein
MGAILEEGTIDLLMFLKENVSFFLVDLDRGF